VRMSYRRPRGILRGSAEANRQRDPRSQITVEAPLPQHFGGVRGTASASFWANLLQQQEHNNENE